MVKARAGAASPYEAWSAGVRAGNVVVTNGPLLEIQVDKNTRTAGATASFYRPLEKLDIVSNGKVIASTPGDGKLLKLTASVKIDGNESFWVAAHAVANKNAAGPDIQAHTSPVYLLNADAPVFVRSAREAAVKEWANQLSYFKGAGMVFRDPANQKEFFDRAEKTGAELRRPLQ
jgi:hypothetical protein